jgi:hypothetical protein
MRVFLIVSSALFVLCCAALAQAIDLRPYGFLPTHNEQYLPREFSSIVQYLNDGSLLVSFRTTQVVQARNPYERSQQPIKLLHLDSSGKLLGEMETLVNRDVPYLWPTKDGFLLISSPGLIFYSADLKRVREYVLSAEVTAIGIVPTLDTIVEFLRTTEPLVPVRHVDMETSQLRGESRTLAGLHPAWMRDAYAIVAHSKKDGQRIIRVHSAAGDREIPLPQLPCRSKLAEVSPSAVMALTCEHLDVVDDRGEKMFSAKVQDGAGQVFISRGGQRFGYAVITGSGMFVADEQRKHGTEYRVTIFDLDKKSKVFSIKVAPAPKLGGAFALSPDGRHLAILKDGELEQIAVP